MSVCVCVCEGEGGGGGKRTDERVYAARVARAGRDAEAARLDGERGLAEGQRAEAEPVEEHAERPDVRRRRELLLRVQVEHLGRAVRHGRVLANLLLHLRHAVCLRCAREYY